MGIKFYCPNGHKLHVKAFLAGKTGICPHCQARVPIPLESQVGASQQAGKSIIVSTENASEGSHSQERARPSAPQSQPAHTTRAHASVEAPAASNAPNLPGPGNGQAIHAGHAGQRKTVGADVQEASTPSTTPSPGNSASPSVAAPMAAPAAPGSDADPIAEAPNAVWYVRPPSGGQYGPAAGDVMRRWLAEGRVTGASYIWREGWPDWKQASAVFPALGGAPLPALPGVNGVNPASSVRTRRFRRANNKTMAITAVIVLGLMSVAAFVALIMVLNKA